MIYLTGFITPKPIPPWVLAQLDVANLQTQLTGVLGTDLLTLVKAILILIVGWIVAAIARSIVRGLLGRTQIDNQIAGWLGGGSSSIPIEKWAGEVVYWAIFLFAIVAFLNALQLQAVSEPLNALLGRITAFLPQLFGAAILLGVAWLLATVVKLIVSRVLGQLNIDGRLNQQVGDGETPATGQVSLSDTIANTLYWFIFLLFLPSVLSTLNLEGTLAPVQTLLNEILAFVPNLIAAIVIGGVGWLVAQIVRKVVTNLLAAMGIDRIGAKFGMASTATSERQPLSQILGSVVYILILIPVAITALDALQIQALSVPARQMLAQVMSLLPRLFAAGVVVGLAYVGGKYLSEIVTSILTGLGFNNVFQWLGLSSLARSQAASAETPPAQPKRTPSQLVGVVVLIAVMGVAVLTAVNILQIEALQALVGGLLVIAGQVLVAVLIFAIGLYLANLAYNLISSAGTRQSRLVAHAARISIIILISAMSLQQMGIATNIVNLAFGILAGGIALAFAVAFGWGGKDIAAEQLREWLNNFKQQ